MKSYARVMVVSASLVLVSGCAYISGMKDDKADADRIAEKAKPVPVPISSSQATSKPPATENAAKAIAPLTGY